MELNEQQFVQPAARAAYAQGRADGSGQGGRRPVTVAPEQVSNYLAGYAAGLRARAGQARRSGYQIAL